MKRMAGILMATLLAAGGAAAWERAASPPQVAYDHYFDAATFFLEAGTGPELYCLVLTYEEGAIDVPAGSTLTLHLRDRSTITLATAGDLRRGDVALRRWRDHTTHYVTCRYPVTRQQLQRMIDKDVYRAEIATARGVIVRSVRNLRAKLASALAAVEGRD